MVWVQIWKNIGRELNTDLIHCYQCLLIQSGRNYVDNIINWNGNHADEEHFYKKIKEVIDINIDK